MGTYSHNLDAKGRMNFPTKLRESLGDSFIITRGLDGCLFVYSREEWAVMEEKISSMPLSKGKNVQRFFFSNAAEIEADKQGRILIPAHLREYAGLEKDVMVIGAVNRAEIWDKDRWNKLNDSFSEDMLTEAMDELGF
ncbi:MAG: division/cell wall cluster transcriptional repressor MraZ [Oscillospiraceae bacterium]|nr:division/cell wall cluster transcriptional repressor MraZ [Oscillospiraceae bacterium]